METPWKIEIKRSAPVNNLPVLGGIITADLKDVPDFKDVGIGAAMYHTVAKNEGGDEFYVPISIIEQNGSTIVAFTHGVFYRLSPV